MFQNVQPGPGFQSVLAVALFVEELESLSSSPAREATREADHAVLASLERRGITKEVLEAMRDDVTIARDTDLPAPGAMPDHEENLRKIHDWLASWSEVARTAITRKDQRIKLGLSRRRPKKAKPAPVPVPPAAPVPVPAFPVASRPLALPMAGNDGPDSRVA